METRVFPFPVLASDSLCYADGVSYNAHISSVEQSGEISVAHRLTGNNLVASLVADQRAKFACVVSVPLTMLRVTYSHQGGGELSADQRIQFEKNELSGTPKLRPIVVCTEEFGPTPVQPPHGLDDFYAGDHVRFPDGAIIADAGWMQFGAHGSILRIKKGGEDMLPGTLHVTISTEDGFYFIVTVASDLYTALQNPNGQNEHRMSVLTCAFSAGLAQIQRDRDLRDRDWKEYQSLQILHRDLEARGLPTWEDSAFSPELTASTIHPHIIVAGDGDDLD